MKKLSLLVIAFVLTMSLADVQAQTADEIINNYIESIGGKEKLSALEGVKMEMVANYQGMEIPVEVTSTKDGKMLVKIDLMGKIITQIAFDGTTGWSTNMMTLKAEKMDSDALENMKKTAGKDFPDPFLDYETKGYSAEYIGKETKEGAECHKIKLTKLPQMINGEKVDDVSFYYFNAENNFLVASESEIKEGPMKGQIARTSAGNDQEVEGIYFPFTMNQSGQAMTVKRVTLNPTIDPKEFEFKTE